MLIETTGKNFSFYSNAFEVNLSKIPKERRRIPIIPTVPEIGILAQDHTSFYPVWTGEINIEITFDGALELRQLENIKSISDSTFGDVSLKMNDVAGRKLLLIHLKINDFSINSDKISSFKEFAQAAEKLLSSELVWNSK